MTSAAARMRSSAAVPEITGGLSSGITIWIATGSSSVP